MENENKILIPNSPEDTPESKVDLSSLVLAPEVEEAKSSRGRVVLLATVFVLMSAAVATVAVKRPDLMKAMLVGMGASKNQVVEADQNKAYLGDGWTNAASGDADQDGISDGLDNCKTVVNSDQADSDGDGVGDVCEKIGNRN